VRWLQPGGFRVSTFVHGLEAAFGSVWVADGTGGRLVRLDPRRRFRPVEVRKQGLWHPTHLAIAAGAVWVGDSGARTVYRVDRRTNRAVRSFRLPGDVMKLVGSGESVWVVTAGPGKADRAHRATVLPPDRPGHEPRQLVSPSGLRPPHRGHG